MRMRCCDKVISRIYLCGQALAVLAVVLSTGCAASKQSGEHVATLSPVQHSELKAELLTMAERDQESRKNGTDPSLSAEDRQRFALEGVEIDRTNTLRLKQIVNKYGWPDRQLVGEDGALASFTLIQHADQDPRFQEQCLPLLEQAANRGEVKKTHVAYLTDRVRVKLDLPQLYGTQYGLKRDGAGNVMLGSDGRLTYLLPVVADKNGLDGRRSSMGLGPWYEYEKKMAAKQGREASTEPVNAATSN